MPSHVSVLLTFSRQPHCLLYIFFINYVFRKQKTVSRFLHLCPLEADGFLYSAVFPAPQVIPTTDTVRRFLAAGRVTRHQHLAEVGAPPPHQPPARAGTATASLHSHAELHWLLQPVVLPTSSGFPQPNAQRVGHLRTGGESRLRQIPLQVSPVLCGVSYFYI